jgi:hypothetical protein
VDFGEPQRGDPTLTRTKTSGRVEWGSQCESLVREAPSRGTWVSLKVGTPPWIRNPVSLPPATDSETRFLRPSGAFSPKFGKETRFLDPDPANVVEIQKHHISTLIRFNGEVSLRRFRLFSSLKPKTSYAKSCIFNATNYLTSRQAHAQIHGYLL